MNVQGASDVMKAAIDKATSKSREISMTEKQIDLIKKQIRALESRSNSMNNERAKAALIARAAELDQKRIELEEKLQRLGG